MALKPSNPDPFAILAGTQAPNGFFLGLTTLDAEPGVAYIASELTEPDVAGYARIPIDLAEVVSDDGGSVIGGCDSFEDDDGVEQYLDFFCGEDRVDEAITGVFVVASYDDGDIVIYVEMFPTPEFWNKADDGLRVQRVDIQVDTFNALP